MMYELYALAMLIQNDKVLLLLRNQHRTFGAGMYTLPGGKVENNERALQAVQREAKEEVGLDLPESAFNFVYTFHRLGPAGPLIALCFKADITGMEPKNMEPELHDAMNFFSIEDLPENLLPAHKQLLLSTRQSNAYSEHGWPA